MASISQNTLIRTYRFYAPLYDFVFGAILEQGRRRLAEAANAGEPTRLLEVGVGTGLMLPRYLPQTDVVGIDLSDEMLQRARAKAAALAGRRVELRHMDAEKMDFPDGTFDCVVVPYVLSVTPDPKRLVAELRRVCRKDGRIILLNHFSGSYYWSALEKMFRTFADKIGFRSDFSYEEQVLAHDWRIESVTDVNILGLSKLVVITNV